MSSLPKCTSLQKLDNICKSIDEKIKQGFNDIIQKSNIDVSANKKLAQQYYSLVKSNDKLEKQIKCLKFWRWFMLIFLIFPFFLMTNAAKKKQKLLDEGSKEENKEKNKLDEQIAPVLSKISYDFCFNQMIEPTWTDIDFMVYQDVANYKGWLPLMNKILPKDACMTCILSGTLFSNPFLIYNLKHQILQPHTYVGTVSIPHTERRNGQTVTTVEVATATETLPEPVWLKCTQLAYHFDKAKNLCFTNNVSKHEYKKLCKKEQVPLENKEFNKVFHTIRNDEKDFRVLFSPLAQENYVNLIKEHGFNIEKNGEVTFVSVTNKSGAYLDVTPNEAFNYDVEVWRDNYIKWVHNFVNNIGELVLPIANIPLYSRFETELDKKKTNLQIASELQVEDNLSFLFDMTNEWSKFDTDVIFEPLKTETTTIGNKKFSITSVRCNYFWPDHQVITKTAISNRGRPLMVPINVIYYRPRHEIYQVYQSIDLGNETIEENLGNNIVIHRGQIMFFTRGNKLNQSASQIINDYLKK